MTLVVGNVVAIVQTNLKRMLAYSTIANSASSCWVCGRHADGLRGGALLHPGVVLVALGSFGVILLASAKGFEADQLEDYKACTSAIRRWRWP